MGPFSPAEYFWLIALGLVVGLYGTLIGAGGGFLLMPLLLLLIATPVVRVAFSIVGFARQRDKAYVLVTMIVLGLLLYSLIGSGW